MFLTAHSGSDGTPENSRLFIEIMSELSVPAVEVDVRKKDGMLYLSHDPVDNIGECLTLREAFQLIAESPSLWVNCDLKEAQLEDEVVALAEHYHIKERLILSGTVELSALPSTFNKQNLYYNPENWIADFYTSWPLNEEKLNELIIYCKEKGIKVLNIHYKLATESLVKRLNTESIGLSVWTVNDYQTIQYFKSNHVHNVTSKAACGYMYDEKKRRMRVD